MTDESPAGSGNPLAGDPDISPAGPPEKMGPAFYAALALIGVLVLMVVILNYPAVRASSGTVMSQTNWTLQSYTDNTGILIPVISGSDVTARFSRDGQVSGSAGCNHYAATYTTRDYDITISGTATTLMACDGPGIMEQESAFLTDLSGAVSFRVTESYLKLYDAGGKPLLVFVPV
jgi:heat shock protein HslJ